MEIEQYIVSRANEVLGTDDTKIIKRLLGGMSNYTYVVESKGKRYTYRVPGKNAEVFVDRDDELACVKAVAPLGLNNETIYFDTKSGEKMAVYVDGTILSDTDIVSYNEVVVKSLKKLHGSAVSLPDYDPSGRLSSYERLCEEQGFTHPAEYHELKEKLGKVNASLPERPEVPCHCDFQTTNLVMGADRLYVLDWEFAGMNDPFYDIACYGNTNMEVAESLLKAYVGHEPSDEELRRLYSLRAFQCLQWYNVATFKDKVGLSEELKTDFGAVAKFFFDNARELIGKC